VQGGSDPIVPVSQVEVLHEALTKVGVESTLEVVKGAGHSFDHPEIEKKVEEFFDRHLKNRHLKKPPKRTDLTAEGAEDAEEN
jgi:dipeptidyl aminopeptidase/acylaminoacyl peptidase